MAARQPEQHAGDLSETAVRQNLNPGTADNEDSAGRMYYVHPMTQSDADESPIFAKLAEAPVSLFFDWRAVLKHVWIWGAAIGIIVAAFRFVAFLFWMKRHQISTPVRLQQHLDLLARRLGIRRRVRLSLLDGHVGPAVLGLLRPQILMPARCAKQDRTGLGTSPGA